VTTGRVVVVVGGRLVVVVVGASVVGVVVGLELLSELGCDVGVVVVGVVVEGEEVDVVGV